MPEDASPASSTPRQTLAMRMAEQSRLRAERAERLARLVPARAGRSEAAAARCGPASQRLPTTPTRRRRSRSSCAR